MAFSSFGDMFFVLLQMICVIIVVAYLITRTKSFTQVLDGIFTGKGQGILILLFGGLGAGLIGAAHRFSLAGFTAVPCATATVLAGLFGGLAFLLAGRKFIGMYGAVLFAVGMETIHLESGDLVLFYTNGVTETINPGEEQFEEERLIETVTGSLDRPPAEIVERIRDTIVEFSGNEPQFDDLTLMVLRVT